MKISLFQYCIVVFSMHLAACETEPGLNASPLSAEALVRGHCTSCHQYTPPDLLPRRTWEVDVLPKMGYLLGFRTAYDSMAHHFEDGALGTSLIDSINLFPKEPTINWNDWLRIRDFYLREAPAALARPDIPTMRDVGKLFKIATPKQRFSPPGTALAKILSPGKIMIGDIHREALMQFDEQGILLKSAKVGRGPVHLSNMGDALWLTVMGNFLAGDHPDGYLVRYPHDITQPVQRPVTGLRRPVHTAFGDLNGDRQTDIVISEFGKWRGQLSWWEKQGEHYRRHLLSAKPGPIRAYIHDFNADGRPDVMALFGQAREGIHIFYNQGDGRFLDEAILDFHPAMGSSYFELHDLDGDGDLDIIYTAGDNADYRPVNKPYQGVYLFRNNGDNTFRQIYFYPLYGAYKAIPADFDLDGDLDLAAISFFPDYRRQAERSFVYLENTGSWEYRTATFKGAVRGRWINMDVGDVDGDGDADIVLGSLAMEIPDIDLRYFQDEWMNTGLPFLILNNQTITKK